MYGVICVFIIVDVCVLSMVLRRVLNVLRVLLMLLALHMWLELVMVAIPVYIDTVMGVAIVSLLIPVIMLLLFDTSVVGVVHVDTGVLVAGVCYLTVAVVRVDNGCRCCGCCGDIAIAVVLLYHVGVGVDISVIVVYAAAMRCVAVRIRCVYVGGVVVIVIGDGVVVVFVVVLHWWCCWCC